MTNKTEKKNEVKEMSNEQTEKKTSELSTKKEVSKEEKKRLRREAMEERGRLDIPAEFKEPGFRYRICNVLPGNIESWKSKGYEVVTHDMQTGSGLNSQPELNGKPVEIEVGGARGSMKAIIMRTTEENAEILDELRDDAAREQAQMVYKDPIPTGSRASESGLTSGTNIGKITKENLH